MPNLPKFELVFAVGNNQVRIWRAFQDLKTLIDTYQQGWKYTLEGIDSHNEFVQKEPNKYDPLEPRYSVYILCTEFPKLSVVKQYDSAEALQAELYTTVSDFTLSYMRRLDDPDQV